MGNNDRKNKFQLQAVEPTENVSVKTKTDKLKDCRLLWISGLEKTVKAEDLRIAFEPYGKGNLLHYMVAYHVFQYVH